VFHARWPGDLPGNIGAANSSTKNDAGKDDDPKPVPLA